ncbi:DUF6401 family natural product biosynthesis protein [Lentzea flaviverrucosa]|uniref:Uncharacterized protein n=1 Tax=Lentzea flaviverrucosa TaxID=200379 RepID=A0A1H9GF25_9PSEU|nr:DUF6401 family natural product biosynthesis protein [Lentzea flaviverrucosa]RDI34929.1 hypothetical protein DFR72_101679 [Lentzea flaviverrucosa]SEQ48659.1 hypothetical protein SAMN05216195_102538 [Lentzea flaviverrucosa]
MRVTWREKNARQWISELSDRIGVAGWAALALTPALAAEVDQHGAAVRDILLFGVEGAGTVGAVVLLAAYGRGLLDNALESDWAPTSWLGVRLMAVCQLAHVHDARPLADEVHALPKLT